MFLDPKTGQLDQQQIQGKKQIRRDDPDHLYNAAKDLSVLLYQCIDMRCRALQYISHHI